MLTIIQTYDKVQTSQERTTKNNKLEKFLTITSSCDKIISTKQRKQQSAKALQTHIVAIKSFC